MKLACGLQRHVQKILADSKCLCCFSGMVKLCEEEKKRTLFVQNAPLDLRSILNG